MVQLYPTMPPTLIHNSQLDHRKVNTKCFFLKHNFCIGMLQFCDMLNTDNGVDRAVVALIRCAWKKFRELSPILTFKGALLKLKG